MIHRVWFEPAEATTDSAAESIPLVLLHEGLGSVAAWGPFPQQLADATGRRVLAFDRRGYGRSSPNPGPWPADFMTEEARLLPEFFADEGLANPILVGHSDGATIALLYPSVRRPDDPDPPAIISLSAHVSVEAVCVEAIEEVRATYREGGSRSLAARLAPHHADADATFEGWSEVWVSNRFRSWTIDEELAAVTCPVLAFQGTADRYATRSQLERVCSGVAGPAEVVDVPDADHWPHREATQLVLDHIVEFLGHHP